MLSDNSDRDSSSTGAVGVLTSDFEQPVVSESSVSSGLLHSLEVLSDLGFQDVGGGVHVDSLLEVSSSVEEPDWDVVFLGLDDDFRNELPEFGADLSGSDVDIDVGDLADGVSESSSDSSDGGQGVGDDSFSNDVGVLDSDDVLERLGVFTYETLTHVFSFINFIILLIVFGLGPSLGDCLAQIAEAFLLGIRGVLLVSGEVLVLLFGVVDEDRLQLLSEPQLEVVVESELLCISHLIFQGNHFLVEDLLVCLLRIVKKVVVYFGLCFLVGGLNCMSGSVVSGSLITTAL